MSTQTDYLDVLRGCGWPTDVVVLDFETYFDESYKLTDRSTVEFVTDERFEVLGVASAWSRGDAPSADPSVLWSSTDEVPGLLACLRGEYGDDLAGVTVVAHNARFDGCVLGLRYGVWPRYCVDLLDLCRHVESRARNDLGSVAERHGWPMKGDTKEFLGWTRRVRYVKGRGRKRSSRLPVRRPVVTPRMEVKLAAYARNDAELETMVLREYLPRLTRPDVELRLARHTLDLNWHPLLRWNHGTAAEVREEIRANVDEAVRGAGLPSWDDASKDKRFREVLGSALARRGERLDGYLKPRKGGGTQLALAKNDPQREELLAHPREEVRRLVEARVAVKSGPLHIRRVDRLCSAADASDGALAVPLKYHGAHTGRWSGDESLNLQNLGSRGEGGMERLRECIEAPPGHVLVVCDYASVEARGTAWVAGQEDKLEAYRQGRDTYSELAAKILGVPVRKGRRTDPPAVKKEYDRRRSFGKVGELGCGYGMGNPEKVNEYGRGFGLDLSREEATALVRTYRTDNPLIVRFWHDLEAAFCATVRYGRDHEVGPLRITREPDHDCTVIVLPSGRWLRYAGVRAVNDGRGGYDLEMTHPTDHTTIRMWGGYLTENVVQAVCRDVMGDHILVLDTAGYRIPLHTHDEVVVVVEERRGEDVLTDVVEVMSTTPDWCEGFPLDAEGCVTRRYRKP